MSRRDTRRREWIVWAERYDKPLSPDGLRRIGCKIYSWRRSFFNLEAAMEQSVWCSEAWPDAFIEVYRISWPYQRTSKFLYAPEPRYYLQMHTRPHMPCGCIFSHPPCSLEHAVRVTA